MKNIIKVGDKVDVCFGYSRLSDYEVLYMPLYSGDSWHLRGSSGDLIYVQLFEIIRLKRGRK